MNFFEVKKDGKIVCTCNETNGILCLEHGYTVSIDFGPEHNENSKKQNMGKTQKIEKKNGIKE